MSVKQESLAPRAHWERTWSSNPVSEVAFDPTRGDFRGVHRLLLDSLPRQAGLRCLEVGCYPGKFMWYFSRFFGYAVEGVEYIGWCCERTRELLAREGLECRVEEADFMSWEPGETWDMVASFGFVEHFADCRVSVARHAALVAPGGWLVLEVPNHGGLYGRIFRRMQPDIYAMHNRMGLADLAEAVSGIPGMNILRAEPCGTFSLAHVGFLERTKAIGGAVHFAALGIKLILEQAFRWLPRFGYLAPYLVVVARKSGD